MRYTAALLSIVTLTGLTVSGFTLAAERVAGNGAAAGQLKIAPVLGIGTAGQWTMPNVARTPSPVGPVPVPYPNIGKGSQSAKRKNPKIVKPGARSKAKSKMTHLTPQLTPAPVVTKVKPTPTRVTVTTRAITPSMTITGHNGGSSGNLPPAQQIAPSQTKVILTP
jgi:hypothetical protein